jgi:hypothetical protein
MRGGIDSLNEKEIGKQKLQTMAGYQTLKKMLSLKSENLLLE